MSADLKPSRLGLGAAALVAIVSVVCAEGALGAVSFAPQEEYPGADVDSDIGALDANGDGDRDLLAVGGQLQLLAGSGDGAFGLPTLSRSANPPGR